MWIEKKARNEYNDCPAHGLRLHFDSSVNAYERKECVRFCTWLRKQFFFPIRIFLCFITQKSFRHIDDGHTYYGIFYSNEQCKRKTYPRIFVASKMQSTDDRDFVLFTIAHELTHYFQWFFYEDMHRTNRSLEIEATRWAKYLLQQYLNTPSSCCKSC